MSVIFLLLTCRERCVSGCIGALIPKIRGFRWIQPPVSSTFRIASGISFFQPRFISWSYRKRGKRPADPHEDEDEEDDLREEHQRAQRRDQQTGLPGLLHERNIVAAEEERGHHRAADEHVHVLGEEVEAQLHAAELGVVAADQFRFTLGQVEGCAVAFGEGAGDEEQEAEGLVHHVPQAIQLAGHDAAHAQVFRYAAPAPRCSCPWPVRS